MVRPLPASYCWCYRWCSYRWGREGWCWLWSRGRARVMLWGVVAALNMALQWFDLIQTKVIRSVANKCNPQPGYANCNWMRNESVSLLIECAFLVFRKLINTKCCCEDTHIYWPQHQITWEEQLLHLQILHGRERPNNHSVNHQRLLQL